MFRTIRTYLEKRAFNGYMDRLCPEMRKRYGGSPPYTEAQVWAAIGKLGLGERFAEFAIVVLCRTKDGNPFHSKELIKLRSYRNIGSEGGACGSCGAGWSGCEGSSGGDGGD